MDFMFTSPKMFCSSKNPYGNKTPTVKRKKHVEFCSSKNPYGNKTIGNMVSYKLLFCSSKNPYGNKTSVVCDKSIPPFCSSKNPYGNKTLVHVLQVLLSSVLAKILMVTKLNEMCKMR